MDDFCWEARIDELRAAKEAAILAQDFNTAADLRDQERKLVIKLREATDAAD
jgi:protein-arginine kinase activator protein McsA